MLHSPFSIICVVCYYFYYDHEWVEGARGQVEGGWGSSGQPQRVINVLNWSMNRVYLPLCFTSKLSSRALPLSLCSIANEITYKINFNFSPLPLSLQSQELAGGANTAERARSCHHR